MPSARSAGISCSGSGGAGEIAAARERAALQVDDLDRWRALRNFQRLDRRQMRADPGDDADAADAEPQADHQRPVGNAADERADAAGRALLARAAFARFRRRRVVDAGAARSLAVTRSSGPVIVVERRLRGALLLSFCGHTQPVPRRRIHGAGPGIR